MVTQAGLSAERSRRGAPTAARALAVGALAMLLVSGALGETGAGTGGLGGAALSAHVQSGSLGWIALGVLAAACGMAENHDTNEGDRAGDARAGWYLAWLAVATVASLVAANSVGSAIASAGAGTAALVAIIALAGWLLVIARPSGTWWTGPRLGIAATLGVLAAGCVLGTVSAWMTVGGNAASASSLATAQSATLGVPFVVLAATSMVEWASAPRPTPAAQVTTAGLVQVGALSIAAVATIAGVLSSDIAVTEANIPLLLGGIAIFLFRVGPVLLARGWARSSRIWLVTCTLALAVDAGLFAHVVFEVGVKRYATAGLVPTWLLFSVDHVTFVGVGTTALLGTIAALFGQADRWSAADTVGATGLVLGLAGVALGLGVGSAVLEGGSAALLGLSVLAAVAVASLRALGIHPSRR
jgi:hypothetical protein